MNFPQITEELEKIKQEMDERGSSMTDGGKDVIWILIILYVPVWYFSCKLFLVNNFDIVLMQDAMKW